MFFVIGKPENQCHFDVPMANSKIDGWQNNEIVYKELLMHYVNEVNLLSTMNSISFFSLKHSITCKSIVCDVYSMWY